MEHTVYLYVPSVTEGVVTAVFRVLEEFSFRPTHMSKQDPPGKRAVTLESAVSTILEGAPPESVNYTFVADRRSGITLTFELRPHPRWPCSVVSMSLPEHLPLQRICESAFASTRAFACLGGRSGAGKHQAWLVSFIAPSCPESLLSQLAGV